MEDDWKQYLDYLREWANSHAGNEHKGMSPACYDEWYDNEYGEVEIKVGVRFFDSETGEFLEYMEYKMSIEKTFVNDNYIDYYEIFDRLHKSDPEDFKEEYSAEIVDVSCAD